MMDQLAVSCELSTNVFSECSNKYSRNATTLIDTPSKIGNNIAALFEY